MAERIVIHLNGREQAVDAAPARPLLEVLQEDLHLAGTHYGCGEGECGACSVLVDGRREFACQVQLADVAGKKVTTIEGLATGDTLHPVQQAFLDVGGFQCGYCTPGIMIAVVGFLNEHPQADDAVLMAAMDKHLCRCCGYVRIAAAIRQAAAAMRGAAR
jgi:aerobic-type carbon monoxide dehydrogenase small subunit (CoxS/CutS family)